MNRLGPLLREHSEAIIDRWYDEWRRSPHPHREVSEDLLRDKLALQLRVIGEQLSAPVPERPREMWKIRDRLDPEDRVEQQIPIEEYVLAHKILVGVVREWIEELSIDVSFQEYTYFYEAIFELVAESMKRYADHQAEQVREARSHYLAAVTHQIRSPLSSLVMGAQLLSETEPPDREVIRSIERSARRLKLLTDGLMRLERFQPDEIPVRPQPIVLIDLIEEVMGIHCPYERESDLEIIREVDPAIRLEADPDLCYDAIGNLVQNAFRHTPSGFVKIRAEENDDQVLIEVIDSGPGIPAERKKHLFEPVSPATGGGAGLGLTIARRAVLAQSGQIGVESEIGKGARFWIRLPVRVKGRSGDE